MDSSSSSMEPFLNSYSDNLKKAQMQRKRYAPEAADIFMLFAENEVESMSLMEIASDLLINERQAKMLTRELQRKNLVKLLDKLDELVVELTPLGKQLIQD